MTAISVINAQLDGTVPIVKIGDGQMRFELASFTIELGFDYEFITNPPIFADIGTASVNIGGMTLVADIESFLEDSFSIQLLDLTLNFTHPGSLLNLDGLNDFGVVINEQIFTEKFSGIINKVLSLVPNDIELFDSDFYIEGLLFSNPTYVDSEYMKIQLDTSI